MMGLVGRLTEVDGGQEGENKRLQERNQEFQAVHENHEGGREDANAVTGGHRLSSLAENEDQAHERQDDDVSRADVRRQTDHQHDRLQEHAHNLNRNDDGHHKQRHARRPKQVAPVVLVAVQCGDQEHQRGKHHGDAKGSRHIEPSDERHQAEKVCKEDEEEHRHQEGQELVRTLLTNVGDGNLVAQEQHHWLEGVGQPCWSLALTVFVAARHATEQHHHQTEHEQHAEDGLGDAEVVHHRTTVRVVTVLVVSVIIMVVTGMVAVLVVSVVTMVVTRVIAMVVLTRQRDVPMAQRVRRA